MTLWELQLYGLANEDFELERNEEIAGEVLTVLFRYFPVYKKYEKDPRFSSKLQLLATLYSCISFQSKDLQTIFDSLLKRFSCNSKEFILCNSDILSYL